MRHHLGLLDSDLGTASPKWLTLVGAGRMTAPESAASVCSMLYRLHFGRQPCWSVRRGDPHETPLPCSGWALLSPALALKDAAWSPPTFVTCNQERAIVYSSDMVFRIPQSESDIVPERLLPIVKWIRFAAGQATLGDVLGGQVLDDSVVGHVVDLFPQDEPDMVVFPHVELTTICHDLLLAQAEGMSSLDVPVYADILLDAIDSDFNGDYMKAVLYSAIAVECVAATRLDEEVRRRQGGVSDDAPSNRSTVAHDANDPTYIALRKRAQRSFRVLLHDLPEYVVRRSLMRADPGLYQALMTLRDTRNKFVHAGIAPGPVEAYGLAKEALTTALRTFAWFRAAGRFTTKHGSGYCAG